MVEGARLESVYTSKGYQGFESLFLRNRLSRDAGRHLPTERPAAEFIPWDETFLLAKIL